MVLRQIPGSQVVESLANAAGWTLVRENSGQDQATITEERTWNVREDILVHMVSDTLSEQCALVVTCSDVEVGEGIRSLMCEQLDPYSPEELVSSGTGSTDPVERVRRLMRVALGAPAYYQKDFFTQVAGFAEDDDPGVRDAVTLAAGYLPWPQMRVVLRRLAEDPHPTVRDDAVAALEMYDASGVPSA